jgi:ketosteroid isomerase-like protein
MDRLPPGRGQTAPMLDSFTAWLRRLGDAWEAADVDAMAALFAPAATVRPSPFAERIRGRQRIAEHWGVELAGVAEVRFAGQVLGAGDTYGIAQYRVSYRAGDGGPSRMRDGILLAALDERGRCTSLRNWWHDAEEEREPSQ